MSHDEPTAVTTIIDYDPEGYYANPTSSIVSLSKPVITQFHGSNCDGRRDSSKEHNHSDRNECATTESYGTATIQPKFALGDPRLSTSHSVDNCSNKTITTSHDETAAISTGHEPEGCNTKKKTSSSTPAITNCHFSDNHNNGEGENTNNSKCDDSSVIIVPRSPQRPHSITVKWTTVWNEHTQSSLIKISPRTSWRRGCFTLPSLPPPLINISCRKKEADAVVSRDNTITTMTAAAVSAKRPHQRPQTITIDESSHRKKGKNRYGDNINDDDDDESWQTEFNAWRRGSPNDDEVNSTYHTNPDYSPDMVTSSCSDGEQQRKRSRTFWNESFRDFNYFDKMGHASEENQALVDRFMMQRRRSKRRNVPSAITPEQIYQGDEDSQHHQWTTPLHSNNSTQHPKAWDQNYELLKQYYTHYGHCNVRVPPSHSPSPLSALTRWIKTQRHQYKRKKYFSKPSSLTEEQIEKLDDLGFEWEVVNDSWWERYDELRRYYREMGNCLVPTGYKENPRLAKWVAKQRQQYVLLNQNKPTQLTLSRLNLLKDLDFVWRPMAVNAKRNDHSWDQRYEELKRFKEEHGHCLVKVKNNKINQPLGTWVRTQRYQYKLLTSQKKSRMTAERVRKLEELDFQWDAATTGGVMSWEERYEELAAYAREMGDTMVPSTFPKNQNLSDWVKAQRHQYKLFKKGKQTRLTPERLQRLDEIQFDSDPVENGTTRYEKSWERIYNELKAYKEVHGDCLVKVKNNSLYPHLGRWVRTQRHQYKQLKEGKRSSMTPQRVEKLNQLGFVWAVTNPSWEERHDELKRFYGDAAARKVGDAVSATAAAAKDDRGDMMPKAVVPETLDETRRLDENPQLAQRHQYQLRLEKKPSQLTPRRIRLLKDIYFRWQQHTTDTIWEPYYRELKRFKERHGHCDVMASSSHSMGNENEFIINGLERWIKEQRHNYHLFKRGIPSEMTQDKITRLEQIGFQWTDSLNGVGGGVPTMTSATLHHHHHPRVSRPIVNLGSLVLPPHPQPGPALVATAQPLINKYDRRHYYRHFRHHHNTHPTTVPHMTVDYPIRQTMTTVPPSSMRDSPWQNPPWSQAAAQKMDSLYHAYQNQRAVAAESHNVYPAPPDSSHWQKDRNPGDNDKTIMCDDLAKHNHGYQQQQQLSPQKHAMSNPSPPQQSLLKTKTLSALDASPEDDGHESGDEWQAKYEELKDFKELNGHCFVSEEDNPVLKEWIDEARLEYQNFMDGTTDDPQSLTEKQIHQLEELGVTDDTSQHPAQKKSDDDSSSTTTLSTANKKRNKALLKVSWKSKYDQLCQYKAEHGNTLVLNRYAPNPSLGVWVKTQRYQYHKLISGKKAKITTERIQLLNDIGFVWRLKDNPSPPSPSTANPTDQPEEEHHQVVCDPQNHWQTKLAHLIEFKKQNHHLLVPNKHPLIGTWVKNLRHQYSKLLAGKPSSLTHDRIQTLNDLGFVWRVSDHGGTWMRRYFELVAFIKRQDVRRHKRNRVKDEDELDDEERFEKEDEMSEQLTKWVAYQRYQYKQYMKGKENQLTEEKKKMLEALGLFEEETGIGGIVVGGVSRTLEGVIPTIGCGRIWS